MFSLLGRTALRSVILLAASALVAGVVYVPVRLMPVPQPPPRRNEINARQMDERVRERRFRDRQPTLFMSLRFIVNQLVAIAIIAFIGRKVLRLSLKR